MKYKAIRTAITVMICLTVSYVFKFKYPFYVAIPAFTTISDTIIETVTMGRNRLIGSIIGAIWGILLSLIKPGDIILTGLGIFVLILFCDFIKLKRSASFATLIFLSIMISIRGHHSLTYSFYRLLYTLVGIIIVIVVNTYIFRINETKIIQLKIDTIKLKIQTMLGKDMLTKNSMDLKTIEIEVDELKKYFDLYQEENQRKSNYKNQIEKIDNTIVIIMNIFHNLVFINQYNGEEILSDENRQIYNQLFTETLNEEDDRVHNESIVYNFHVNKALLDYSNLLKIDKER